MEILTQDMKILNNSVNYEDGWRKREKMWKIKKNIIISSFYPENFWPRGPFSIPWTAYFNKFLPNLVNHDQDWMSIKFNPLIFVVELVPVSLFIVKKSKEIIQPSDKVKEKPQLLIRVFHSCQIINELSSLKSPYFQSRNNQVCS